MRAAGYREHYVSCLAIKLSGELFTRRQEDSLSRLEG